MIHQFAQLGRFYQEREGVGSGETGRLAQFAQDPAQKFRTTKVLTLLFSKSGFERVEVDEYDESKRLKYLYRAGPPNRCDATPTTGLQTVKKDDSGSFDANYENALQKKLIRLTKSIEDAKVESGAGWESGALAVMGGALAAAGDMSTADRRAPRSVWSRILEGAKACHQPDSKKGAILSVAWRDETDLIHHVGDFECFRGHLVRQGERAASGSKRKGSTIEAKGVGQCCVCGSPNVEVLGQLKVFHPPLFTLDKPGSISGGFEASGAWKNFPVCRVCCEQIDFAGERIKRDLTFSYYSSFKYMFLPLPVRPEPTFAYDLLDRLIAARVNKVAAKRLTQAEDELFHVVAEEENNRLQVDLVFYQPDPQSFRPALYVSGLLPSRFRQLFAAKDSVDCHAWLNPPSPTHFSKGQFTFGSFYSVFPHAHGGSNFDDDFLAATRAALELRPLRHGQILHNGMRWVRQDYRDGKPWQFRLADIFRSILFFDELLGTSKDRSDLLMPIDFGTSPQADRVRNVLQEANGKLKTDPAAQAAFLVGACCSRIEAIQKHRRDASPFEGKLKGFRLSQRDVQSLFVAAKDKAKAYGEKNFETLLECAAVALTATPENWPLSPDEVSYFFALGHALRPRLAGDTDTAKDTASN